jgi:hypothetical protein
MSASVARIRAENGRFCLNAGNYTQTEGDPFVARVRLA